MKLISLFDGSGGFPLAGALCGITPIVASEIEPYPIAVTRSRFPSMTHLGDVSKVNGAELEPADIITFGSPCQDLSVAGKRAGLKHEDNGDEETTRSGLFMEAIRIIKEMREATNGKYPRYAVWENVPGAFSSNKGKDFRVVLEEFVKVVEPSAEMPPMEDRKWPYADVIVGDGWSIAYRTLDAQYWGVPQRRRRIYLVADFAGERAPKILFERDGLRGHSPESGQTREDAAGTSEDRPGTANREGTSYTLKIRNGVERDCYGKKAGKGPLIQTEKSATLGVSQDQYLFTPEYILDDQGGQQITVREDGKTPTLRAETHGNLPCVIENHPNDSRVDIDESGTVQTLTGRMGTGGGNVPVVMEQKAYATGNGQADNSTISDTFGALDCMHDQKIVIEQREKTYIVRRLTPTECARLQGFPDWWGEIDRKEDLTDKEYEFWLNVRNTMAAINGKAVKEYTKEQMLKWYNKLHTDSAEYKMWGNGIALPCALYVMQGIVQGDE